jgi:uncharacterized protein
LEIKGEYKFAAPRTVVWEALLDPVALQASMPGCERFDKTGTDAYDITIKVGIAAIKGTYEGTVTVTERSPEDSYRLVVDGGGKPGKVQGDAMMRLEDDGEGTVVRYEADVKAQGAIARMGNRLLGGAAKLLVGQFFKAMDKEVQQRVA